MEKWIEDCGNETMWINTDHLICPIITMSFKNKIDYISIEEKDTHNLYCISLSEPVYINNPEELMSKEEVEEFYNLMKENWNYILSRINDICIECDGDNCPHCKSRNIKEMPNYRLLGIR